MGITEDTRQDLIAIVLIVFLITMNLIAIFSCETKDVAEAPLPDTMEVFLR